MRRSILKKGLNSKIFTVIYKSNKPISGLDIAKEIFYTQTHTGKQIKKASLKQKASKMSTPLKEMEVAGLIERNKSLLHYRDTLNQVNFNGLIQLINNSLEEGNKLEDGERESLKALLNEDDLKRLFDDQALKFLPNLFTHLSLCASIALIISPYAEVASKNKELRGVIRNSLIPEYRNKDDIVYKFSKLHPSLLKKLKKLKTSFEYYGSFTDILLNSIEKMLKTLIGNKPLMNRIIGRRVY